MANSTIQVNYRNLQDGNFFSNMKESVEAAQKKTSALTDFFNNNSGRSVISMQDFMQNLDKSAKLLYNLADHTDSALKDIGISMERDDRLTAQIMDRID